MKDSKKSLTDGFINSILIVELFLFFLEIMKEFSVSFIDFFRGFEIRGEMYL